MGGLALTIRLIYLVGVARDPLSHESGAIVPSIAGAGLFAEPHPLALRLAQALLDSGTTLLLGAVAGQIWGSSAGLMAATLAALYGPLVYFSGEPVPAARELLLVSASLYFTLRGAKRGSRLALALAGLSLSLGALTRPILLLFALIAAVWLSARRVRAGGITAYLACGAAPPLLVLALASRTGGVAGPGAGAEWAEGALDFLRNVALAWNRRELPGRQDQQFFAPFHSWLFRLPWLVSFWFVAPVAVVTAWLERRQAALLVSFLAFATAATALRTVSDESRLLLAAGILPLAGRGIERFVAAVSRIAPERGLKAAIAGITGGRARVPVALALALALVVVPFAGIQRTQAGPSWLRLAQAYERAGESASAAAAYAAAERTGWKSPELYASWGSFERSQGLGTRAEQHLILAISLAPGHARPHEELAELYEEGGIFPFAAQEYAVAAGLDRRRSAELFTDAGNSYDEAGDSDRARMMFRRALEARPGYGPAQEGLDRLDRPRIEPRAAPVFPPLRP